MDIFVQLICVYITVLPYTLPFIIVSLIVFNKEENRKCNERIEAYAQLRGVSMKEAKKIIYPW